MSKNMPLPKATPGRSSTLERRDRVERYAHVGAARHPAFPARWRNATSASRVGLASANIGAPQADPAGAIRPTTSTDDRWEPSRPDREAAELTGLAGPSCRSRAQCGLTLLS